MKYIKNFEENSEGYIKYQMYIHISNDTHVCYVGDNGSTYPSLCLLFRLDYWGKQYEFIDWIEGIELKPLNIDVRDYIIDNNLVTTTLNSLKRVKFASGPSGKDKELIKEFKKYLLSDDRIKITLDAEKYNI